MSDVLSLLEILNLDLARGSAWSKSKSCLMSDPTDGYLQLFVPKRNQRASENESKQQIKTDTKVGEIMTVPLNEP